MRKIHIAGVNGLRPVPGASGEWYFGIGYEQGDIYEAEEIFRAGGTVRGRALCLVKHPEGRVYRPVPVKENEYPGEPAFCDGKIAFPLVRFAAGEIRVEMFDCATKRTKTAAVIPYEGVKDCYNLAINAAPLTLTRHVVGEELEILWPERVAITPGERESFFHREGEKLYFARWCEDPDYREETVVRNLRGKLIAEYGTGAEVMPDGELWLL